MDRLKLSLRSALLVAPFVLSIGSLLSTGSALGRDDGRYADSPLKPWFDSLRSGQTQTTIIKQYELGLKTNTKLYSAFLTAFYNTFSGLSFQQILANGNTINSIGGSDAKGLEAEVSVRPLAGLELTFSGDWLDAKYKDFGANTGNRVQRQGVLFRANA